MLALLARYHAQLSRPAPEAPRPQPDPLPGQIDAVLRLRPAVFSFTFGRLPADVLARCRELGILTIDTATSVRETVALEQDGVDAVVAQGAEAGGHRGTFLDDFEHSMIGTMALVPQVADAVSIPVIASGGIMDGRGIAAAGGHPDPPRIVPAGENTVPRAGISHCDDNWSGYNGPSPPDATVFPAPGL